MKIAIAGGTGTVGRLIAEAATAAGHQPVILARSTGVDLLNGQDLSAPLAGVEAVIDVSGSGGLNAAESIRFFGNATRALMEAGRRAGVRHHVALSIIGAAAIDADYYAGKALQERMLMEREGGWSILRTTQFHEFAGQISRRGRFGPLQLTPRMRSQPVAAAEVAAELLRIATGTPKGLLPDLAGPHEERMADMVRRYLMATRRSRPVIEMPMLGAMGRGMRDGSLLPGPGARLGQQSFSQWLKTLPA